MNPFQMGWRDHGSAASSLTYELELGRHDEYIELPPSSDDGQVVGGDDSSSVHSSESTDLILTLCILAKWFRIVLASTITH